MNQIICMPNIDIKIPGDFQKHTKPKIVLLKLLFFFLVFIAISTTIFYIFLNYNLINSEKLSNRLLSDFNITSLYDSSYSISRVNKNVNFDYYEKVSNNIIGIIEIKKLNIVYPILSEDTKEYLKMAPCRFYGPNPNEIGNMCIAAHNYKNDKFFSKISELKKGDIITIYNQVEDYIDYIVYSIYVTNKSDIACLEQDTNNKRVITLVTCDSMDNNYRTIVKAIEI